MVGMCMRRQFLAGLVAMAALLTAPAVAERVTFSPQAFQVFGAIEQGGARKAVRFSDIPEELRSRTIRLVQAGDALMRGGYRALLRPRSPKK